MQNVRDSPRTADKVGASIAPIHWRHPRRLGRKALSTASIRSCCRRSNLVTFQIYRRCQLGVSLRRLVVRRRMAGSFDSFGPVIFRDGPMLREMNHKWPDALSPSRQFVLIVSLFPSQYGKSGHATRETPFLCPWPFMQHQASVHLHHALRSISCVISSFSLGCAPCEIEPVGRPCACPH